MSPTILCLTHSTRKIDCKGCDLNFLTNRYKDPERLQSLPPLSNLENEYLKTYTGSYSIWLWHAIDKKPFLRTWRVLPYKCQQAAIWGSDFIIAGTAFVELYKTTEDERPFRIIEHPLMAGNHTFEVLDQETFAISCSASDSVLIFNRNGTLKDYYRVPESLYGKNYEFPTELSLREHYIYNDIQLTHLNSVSEYAGGFLVSTLIQGAVGHFDKKGKYREIIAGFIGAHGARAISGEELYFCDSVNGCIVVIDPNGKIIRRYGTGSRWLQDAVWIENEVFLCGCSDRNKFELWDFNKNQIIWEIDGEPFGETTAFISISKKTT